MCLKRSSPRLSGWRPFLWKRETLWGTAEIGQAVDDGLAEIATYKPYVIYSTVTPSAGTPDCIISAITNLLYGDTEESFESVEFQIDKEPKRFRNFTVREGTLTMDISFAPDGTDTARLAIRQPHILGGSGTTSLTPEMEQILIDLVAGNLAVNVAIDHTNQIPKGGAQTVPQFISWGERKIAKAQRRMEGLVQPTISKRWPVVV